MTPTPPTKQAPTRASGSSRLRATGRRAAVLTVASLLVAACSSGSSPSVDPVDSVDSTVAADTTVAVETTVGVDSTTATDSTAVSTAAPIAPDTVVPTSTADSASTDEGDGMVSLSASACAGPSAAVGSSGEVTFVADGKVWAVEPDGTDAACYYQLRGESVNRLQWSPDSSAVLLGSDLVARGDKVTPSGFLATNNDVNWSGPSGKSLLATTSTADLVKRDSRTGARTDISFLDEHRRSAYHPAGRHVVSIGSTANPDGGPDDLGIFVATNTGAEPQMLVDDASNAELSDLAFSASGNLLFFLAGHPDDAQPTYHVHKYSMATGEFFEVQDLDRPVAQLTVSTAEPGVAVRFGACDDPEPTDILVSDGDEDYRSLRSLVPGVGDGWLSPVGWLPGRKMVFLSRSGSCSSPGTLGVADLESRNVRMLARDISMAATRVLHSTPTELDIDLGRDVAA